MAMVIATAAISSVRGAPYGNDDGTIDTLPALPAASGARLEPGQVSHADVLRAARRAQDGSAAAAAWLGLAYYYGDGVARDASTALRYFTQAAQGGHAGAAANAGTMFLHGIGAAPDVQAAYAYFARADGDGEAALQAGRLLVSGSVGSHDREGATARALTFFETAVRAKVPAGYYYLGSMYEYGAAHVAANFGTAAELYTQGCALVRDALVS